MFNLGFFKLVGKWVMVIYHDLDLIVAFDKYHIGAGVQHVSDTIEGALAKAAEYDVDVIIIINHHTLYYCVECGKLNMQDSLSAEDYHEHAANGFTTDGKGNIVIHSGICLNCAHVY